MASWFTINLDAVIQLLRICEDLISKCQSQTS